MIKSKIALKICIAASVLSLSGCANHDQNGTDAVEGSSQHQLQAHSGKDQQGINANHSKPEINLNAVSDWLNSIDNGSYQQSWQNAAPFFQSHVSERNWV
ncbi:protein involved in sex pheromone biosynthesis [Endozoicomonas sp. NE40]|uniref:Protein involved in sex pheromone biosynthesis n=1 Tax=Endozoicomonas lisbonensis TaxID=3120522 RepID=A0ABV2SL98_9GAMM